MWQRTKPWILFNTVSEFLSSPSDHKDQLLLLINAGLLLLGTPGHSFCELLRNSDSRPDFAKISPGKSNTFQTCLRNLFESASKELCTKWGWGWSWNSGRPQRPWREHAGPERNAEKIIEVLNPGSFQRKTPPLQCCLPLLIQMLNMYDIRKM